MLDLWQIKTDLFFTLKPLKKKIPSHHDSIKFNILNHSEKNDS